MGDTPSQNFAFFPLTTDIRVYITCTNCKALMEVIREKGMLSGMGLACPKCHFQIHVEFRTK